MRGKASKADILLGVCYRPPNQDEEVDEVFYKRLAEVSLYFHAATSYFLPTVKTYYS